MYGGGPGNQEAAGRGHLSSDILTRQAFENAMVVVNITGGSTNAVLHLIAMADAVGVKLDIEDFQSVSDRIPSSRT